MPPLLSAWLGAGLQGGQLVGWPQLQVGLWGLGLGLGLGLRFLCQLGRLGLGLPLLPLRLLLPFLRFLPPPF